MPRRRGRGPDCSRRRAAVCLASFAALPRFAEISAAAVFAGSCSQNRRASICLFRPLDGRVDPGWHPDLLAGRRRFSPIKFFLTKNPLPSAIDPTERACGLRPCR